MFAADPDRGASCLLALLAVDLRVQGHFAASPKSEAAQTVRSTYVQRDDFEILQYCHLLPDGDPYLRRQDANKTWQALKPRTT